jgi:hypothetical protein
MVTGCELEWMGPGPTGPPRPPDPGLLAVTDHRLVYQRRATQTAAARSLSLLLAALSVVVLFLSGLVPFVALAGTALGLWVVAKLGEVATIGSANVEFGRVGRIDRPGQRIEGVLRSGAPCRFRIPDPSDFLVVRSLLDRYGPASAA